MIGIVFAVLTAVVWSLRTIIVRNRLSESNPLAVNLVIAVISNIIIWPLALLFSDLTTISFEGVLFFAIAGTLAPGISRLLFVNSIEIVGASVSTSIFATSPMYSSIFAVLLLGEAIAPQNCIGITCIVVGVVYVERTLSEPKTRNKRIFKKGLVFSLLAAVAAAFAIIFRKHGLHICSEPLLGVAIANSFSLFVYLLLPTFSLTPRGSVFSSKGFRLFWKAGACSSLGQILFIHALSQERVSIVAPLVQTQPLFVLPFAYLYLKKLEHISYNLVIGAVIIVTGAMLISIR